MHKTRRRKMTVDVDQGKKAEEQSKFLAQLQASLNVIPAYTWYAAPSGGLTFVNKRTADYLGLPKDHPLRFGIDIGAQWDAHIPLLHPDDHEKSRKSWSTCLRTGEFAEESFRVRNAQGDYRWFRSRVEPLRASDGTLLQWVGLNVDIEELKCAEQALRESEYKLRQIIDTVPSLLWSAGPDGEPTHVSQRLLDYSGMRFEEFKHVGWKAFVHPDDFPETAKAYYHAIQTGTSYRLYTACVGRRMANIVGTMLAVSRCATERGGSFSGTACLLILMKARRPKTGYAAAKPIWRKHRG